MAILLASITKDRRLPESSSITKTRSKGTTVIILWNSWANKHKLFLGPVEKNINEDRTNNNSNLSESSFLSLQK